MSRATTIKVNLSPQEFTCPVSWDIPKQPVLSSCCGITFDFNSVKELRSCPCCRSTEGTFSTASSVTQGLLERISSALSATKQDTTVKSISIDLS